MPPIRVLQLVVSTGLGGGPAHVRDLCAGLPPGEFEVTVAGPRAAGDGEAGLPALEVATDRLAFPPGPLARVVGIVRRRRIDVVHSHGKGAGLYGRLAARWAGAAAVHTFHGLHHEGYGRAGGAAYLALERALARLTHTVIHVSRSQAAEAAALGLAPAGRARVVVNGIDAARVRALARDAAITRAALGLPAGARVVGTVARLDRVKALDVLLAGVARLARGVPDAVLLVVGDGPEGAALRARAAALGLGPRVIWAGALPDAARCLPALDVWASASRREGLPLGLLEAMACALPVVATRVPGHVDAVEDEATGLLVPADDPEALAQALTRVLADPARARAMGEAGRDRVDREFSAARMAEETAAVYQAAARRIPAGN